jgi:transcription termination factor NusB
VKVLQKGVFSSNLLDKAGQKLEKAGADHDLFYTLVKGVIKMHRNLDWIAATMPPTAPSSRAPTSRCALCCTWRCTSCCLREHPDHAALHETVDLAKKLFGQHVADWVNGMARAAQRSRQGNLPRRPQCGG